MELKLLKLVYEYSRSKRYVDKHFIEELISIVVDNKDLSTYVRNFEFTDKFQKDWNSITVAGYQPLLNKIVIDFQSVVVMMDNLSKYDCLFDSVELYMYRNLVITQFVLHELEHASQFKLANDKHNKSIEARFSRAFYVLQLAYLYPHDYVKFFEEILKNCSLDEYMDRSQIIYGETYEFNPIERLAQVNSYKSILSALEPIKSSIPNLYEYMTASYFQQLLNGYEESWSQGVCPTQVYLYAINQQNIWGSLDFYDQDVNRLKQKAYSNYDLKQRFYFGFPVSYEEFSRTNDYMRTLNKFNV